MEGSPASEGPQKDHRNDVSLLVTDTHDAVKASSRTKRRPCANLLLGRGRRRKGCSSQALTGQSRQMALKERRFGEQAHFSWPSMYRDMCDCQSQTGVAVNRVGGEKEGSWCRSGKGADHCLCDHDGGWLLQRRVRGACSLYCRVE